MRLTGVARCRQAARGVVAGVFAVLMLACANNGSAHDARLVATGPLLPPGFNAGRPPVGLIAPPWGCAPGVRNCISQEELRILLERQRRFENLRQDAPAAGVLPMPLVRPMPPPTPENEVQPAYRESGSIRPEFRDSGAPLNPR